MKSLLVMALVLVTSAQVMAKRVTIELNTNAEVFRGAIRHGDHLITYRPGTRLVIDSGRDEYTGKRFARVIRVKRPNGFNHPARVRAAFEINDNSDIYDYFIKVNTMRASTVVNGRNNPRRPVVRPTPSRPVVRPTPSRPVVSRVVYDTYSYDRCYQVPMNRYRVIDQKQRDRGNALTVIGIGAGIFGQLIGGTEGDIISGVGLGLGIVGLVDLSQSTEVIFDSRTECRQYYQTEVRYVTIQQRRCETTRYYTSGWGRSTEYFETTCSGDRYMTFERNNQVWY